MGELKTQRLLLRHWRESDLDPWAEMNADPQVREFFPNLETREKSTAAVALFQTGLQERGWGWWAVEVAATGEFIGFTGLNPINANMPFTGVETGWRLRRTAWGHGYASEAARACLAYGFDTLALPEILAFTAAGNVRSEAVMRRIGMTRDPDGDFDHPNIPDGPVRRHILYRIAAPAS
ncbi:GNAT family N-acetyltransferase [Polymorphospora rubra]|uniref:GNAT family N-acetyltransferase n=1 Tax=Polymorphospora rubra TaxID=338584 RepID=UPI00340A64F5